MKVQHPTFSDVVHDVTDPGPWLEQGWLEYSEPKATAPRSRRPRRKANSSTTGTPAGDMDVAPATSDDQEVKEASDGE